MTNGCVNTISKRTECLSVIIVLLLSLLLLLPFMRVSVLLSELSRSDVNKFDLIFIP